MILFNLLTLAACAEVQAISIEEAKLFIEELGKEMKQLSFEKNNDDMQIARSIVSKIDEDVLGKLALGPKWNEISQEKRKTTMKLLEVVFLKIGVKWLKNIGCFDFKITKATKESTSDVLINTEVMSKNDTKPLKWIVRKTVNGLKIIDVLKLDKNGNYKSVGVK